MQLMVDCHMVRLAALCPPPFPLHLHNLLYACVLMQDVAACRNAARPPHSRVPCDVLQRAAAVFEFPIPTKHVWDRNTLCVSTGAAA